MWELSYQIRIFFKRVICNTSGLVCSRRSSEEKTDPLKMAILNYQAEKEKRTFACRNKWSEVSWGQTRWCNEVGRT